MSPTCRSGTFAAVRAGLLAVALWAGLHAMAQAPVLSFTPPSLVFGPEAVGTTGPGHALTLTNTGTATANNLLPFATTRPQPDITDYLVLSTTCGSSLAVNESCTVTVAFRPTAAGLRSGAVAPSSLAVFATLGGVGSLPGAKPGSIVAIAGGGQHTCARTSGGGMKCWGFGGEGQLGDGTGLDRHVPDDVTGLESHVAAISVGGGHTCALTDLGGLACWGSNVEGMLGNDTLENRMLPGEVAGGTGIASIAAGYLHTCAVTRAGAVQCWGANNYGQLGNESPQRQLVPGGVNGLVSDSATVTAGDWFSCALSTQGQVKCWGLNGSGQLGNGVVEDFNPVPQEVVGLGGIRVDALGAGHSHACALRADGAVLCWGDNLFGQLGDGTHVDRLQPVPVRGLETGVVAISVKSHHSCALLASGGVKCWGSNEEGQLGDGTRIDSPVPVDVDVTGATAIGTGQFHSCAALAEGMKCWGLNTRGQLGDGTTVRRLVPASVAFPIPDTTPEPFTFASRSGVQPLSPQISDAVTPAGYDSPAPISVTNGSYSIGCSAYVTFPGTIDPGQSVCVQHNAAADAGGASKTTTLTIGGVSGTFTTTTTAPAALSLTPPSLDFGSRMVGTTSTTQVATFTNTGGSNATFFQPSVSGDFAITATTCAGSLAPGLSCTITVAFTPTAIGARAGSLTVSNFINPAAIPLTGTGLDPFSVAPEALDFPGVPVGSMSAGQVVTLTNRGGEMGLTVAPLEDGFAILSQTCAGVMPASSTCTFTIGFRPGSMNEVDSRFIVQLQGQTRIVALHGTAIRALQSVTFGRLQDRGLDGGPVKLAAFASSRLPVAFESRTPAVCTVEGAAVVPRATGTCEVAATQPGDGAFQPATPVVQAFKVGALQNPLDGVAIEAGNNHSCVVNASGAVKCWGLNREGQLGNGASGNGAAIVEQVPVEVPGLGATAVAAGYMHTCAVTSEGGVKCWGNNHLGRLGDGTTALERLVPVDVVDYLGVPLRGVVAIGAGDGHTCVLTSAGAVKCWGWSGTGSTGHGVSGGIPWDVTGLSSGAVSIGIAWQRGCAVRADGRVTCWGEESPNLPVDLSSLDKAVAVGTGRGHACALSADGGVRCWGLNSNGALGNGTLTHSGVPVPVTGLGSGVAAISAGGNHTCALTMQGVVKCWGHNSVGQLGNGGTQDSAVPMDVPGLSDVVAISAGEGSTCALTASGAVRCWGENTLGILGVETTVNPVVNATGVTGLGGEDFKPDNFAFAAQLDAAPGKVRTSNTIVPVGYQEPAAISVVNGEYSIGCTHGFTSAAGTISPGQSVCVRHVASNVPDTTVRTILDIGSVSGSFVSRSALTRPAVSPAALAFPPQAVGTTGTPQGVTVTNEGPDTLYDLGWGVGANFTVKSSTCADTLEAGASCTILVAMAPLAVGNHAAELFVFSSSGSPAQLRVLLSGGGNSTDATPDPFTFVDQFLVPINTPVMSAPVQITGLAGSASITVIGGTYAISSANDCSGNVQAFTANPGTIANNQYACVRHTSSAVPGGSNDTQLIVGGLGDTFTTVTRDPVPAPFALAPQSKVAVGTMRTSAPVAITGINATARFTVNNGEVSVNCSGTFATRGSLDPGSSLCARHRTAAGFGASTVTTVNIEGVEGTFTTSTFAADDDADDDGIPNAVEYRESRNPEFKDNDVFNSARLFAMQQYRDFLGREGDPAGIGYWTGEIAAQARTRAQATQDFFASPEFEATVAPVVRLYFAYFLRIPDDAGLRFWIGESRRGTTLDGISEAFAESDEFRQTYGSLTNAQFVDRVYRNVLGRAPDSAGVAFWTGQLDSRLRTRGQVMTGFSESGEYRGAIASEVYVTMMYLGMLRRAPEPAGFAFWVGFLDEGNAGLALIEGFLGTPEYRSRFMP